MITKPLLVLKKFAFAIAITYSAFIAIASLSQWGKIPKIEIESGDKYVHCIAYCIMTITWFNAFFNKRNLTWNKSILLASLISFIFGIIIEVLQGVATSSRTLDYYDMVANTLGIALGVLILNKVFRKDVKNI